MELPEIKQQFFELLKTKFTSDIFTYLYECKHDLIGNFTTYDDFINYQWYCLFHYDVNIITTVYQYLSLDLPCYVDLTHNNTINNQLIKGFIFNCDGLLIPYKL